MRYHLLTWWLILTFAEGLLAANHDSRSRFPFQVIHAKSAFSVNYGTAVNKLRLLEKDAIIVLDSGHLIVAHFDGMFFEFFGTDTLDFARLFENLPSYDFGEYKRRPQIEMLFDSTRIKKERKITTSVLHPPRPGQIEFDLPEAYKDIFITKKGVEFELRWHIVKQNSQSRTFIVTYTNIFDEVLARLEVDEPMINVDFNEYPNESGLYLVSIADKNDPTIASPEMAFEMVDEGVTASGEANTAIGALSIAFEAENDGNLLVARSNYQLAEKLSNQQIYKDILMFFYDRHGLNNSGEKVYEKDH